MSTPDGCHTCNLHSITCSEDIHRELTALLHSGRSLEDLLKELLALRATHSCTLAEANTALKDQNSTLSAEVSKLKEEVTRLENELRDVIDQRDRAVVDAEEAALSNARVSRLTRQLFIHEVEAAVRI